MKNILATTGYLTGKAYSDAIENLPILCVDVDIVTQAEELGDVRHVLFKRCNEPLKGQWWLLGGRVYKGEKAEDAVRRKLKEECGYQGGAPLRFLGYYEEQFEFSSLGRGAYHTVSLVFQVKLHYDEVTRFVLDKQHEAWGLFETIPSSFFLNGDRR